eukprot:TRINITY_DN11132_c0_g1_i1.p2 TRINITY_DN11132_c0_g1~~TRINITY_DN11132_c0_g1_i1.p2  ORF type:complete len:274 (+),score=32.59 TRINITY_DN11132_c0_g1_i1:59-880(+)
MAGMQGARATAVVRSASIGIRDFRPSDSGSGDAESPRFVEPKRPVIRGVEMQQPSRLQCTTNVRNGFLAVIAFIAVSWAYMHRGDPATMMLSMATCFDRVARDENITYWLDYGALLGAERHRGFVPWDKDGDLDIGILASSSKALKAATPRFTRECGFRVLHRDDATNPGITVWGVRRSAFRFFYDSFTPIYLDIADYEVTPGDTLTDTHFTPHIASFPRTMVLPTRPCTFERKTFPCPRDTDGYLTLVYGDWRTPKRNANSRGPPKTDPPAA